MRRTQLYLEDDLWKALHLHSRQSGLSMSELVRRAARERYLGAAVRRQEAMRALVGIWKDRPDIADAEGYVRKLRKGRRLGRLAR
jgi:hypothetical protein